LFAHGPQAPATQASPVSQSRFAPQALQAPRIQAWPVAHCDSSVHGPHAPATQASPASGHWPFEAHGWQVPAAQICGAVHSAVAVHGAQTPPTQASPPWHPELSVQLLVQTWLSQTWPLEH
jgi:hypothetical protein